MAYIDGFNKYTIAGLPSKIAPDHTGGVFITSDKDIETVIHLDKDYSLVKELKIDGLLDCANFEENRVDPKMQRIYSISYINDLLLISLTDNTTVVVDEEGNILNVLKVHKLSKDRVGVINYSIRCIFTTLNNDHILIVAHSKFHGSFLAKSTSAHSDFTQSEMIESVYLNDTYRFPTAYMLSLHSMTKKDAPKSIGTFILDRANDYMMNKDPNKEHVHYVDDMRIWDTVEIEEGYLLLFLFTNMANKSTQPNKNMPYFFVKMDVTSGEVVKIISPEDRAIFKMNLLPRFIINDGRVLFKTMDAIYEISSDLNMTVIYRMSERSMFKKLFPVSYDVEQIHFINPDKGELFSYSNKKQIESEVENLLKSYRKQKKAKTS